MKPRKARNLAFIIIPAIAAIILLLVIPNATNPRYTFSVGPNYNTQSLSLTANSNKVVDLNLSAKSLLFFGVSGSVEGNAKIALRDGKGSEYVVYSNIRRASLLRITGYSSFYGTKEYFSNACYQTCVLNNAVGPFQLAVYVEPGTTLKISSISYR